MIKVLSLISVNDLLNWESLPLLFQPILEIVNPARQRWFFFHVEKIFSRFKVLAKIVDPLLVVSDSNVKLLIPVYFTDIWGVVEVDAFFVNPRYTPHYVNSDGLRW